MRNTEENRRLLSDFGKAFVMLFKRAFMYGSDHTVVREATESTYKTLDILLKSISPVVFLLNGDRFYIDEEPLDSRISVWRMASHFKKARIDSVCFYHGVSRHHFRFFCETLLSVNKFPNANAINKELFKRGLNNIKLNHIFYKKVSVDDEMISGDALDRAAGSMTDDTKGKLKEMILESVFNSVLMENFVSGLNMQNIIENPDQISDFMIASDIKTAKKHDKDGQRPGHFLIHQLEAMGKELSKNISEKQDISLDGLVNAMTEMRQKLIDGIEAQKKLGIVYSNEEQIIDKANEITNNVLIDLIKEEYNPGETDIPWLAQIICRIVPDVDELKQLFPRIKIALLDEGMSLADFKALVMELQSELKSDSLAVVLSKSAEEIGLDGEKLIEKVLENPLKSAEMIYLVSEINKGGGDENKLTEILVDYIEQVGLETSDKISNKEAEGEEVKIRQVMMDAKSDLFLRLDSMDLKKDSLKRLQEKLNDRIDIALDKIKKELIEAQEEGSSLSHSYVYKHSVLETLEQCTSFDDPVDEYLQVVRRKVESGEIDENNFNQIYEEISNLEQAKISRQEYKLLPAGIFIGKQLITSINKELERASRYNVPLTVLGFSLIYAREKADLKGAQIKKRDVIEAIMLKLAKIIRNVDIIGEFKNNHIIALLPMSKNENGYSALYRATKLLNLQPLTIYGIPIEIKIAGISIPPGFKPLNATELTKQVETQISEMTTRLRSIHGY